MQKIRIETDLIKRDNVFRLLALGQATRLPTLLVGVPGTAKTKAVTDFTFAQLAEHDASNGGGPAPSNEGTAQTSFSQAGYDPRKIFIIETDHETKSSEIKGQLNLQELYQNKQYVLDVPAAEAKSIVINEVDKANGGFRRALLGIMNEKMIMNGRFLFNCDWNLFVGTCNEIPEDEKHDAFWDRFIFKYEVHRIEKSDHIEYYKRGGRKGKYVLELNIPSDEDLDKIDLPADKFDVFLQHSYDHLSDRTLTHVPRIIKAISVIWGRSIDMAIVKTAELLVSRAVANDISKRIMPAKVKDILSDLSMFRMLESDQEKLKSMQQIREKIRKYYATGEISMDDVNNLKEVIDEIGEGSGKDISTFGAQQAD